MYVCTYVCHVSCVCHVCCEISLRVCGRVGELATSNFSSFELLRGFQVSTDVIVLLEHWAQSKESREKNALLGCSAFPITSSTHDTLIMIVVSELIMLLVVT